MADWFHRRARLSGGKIALVDATATVSSPPSYTYAELDALAGQMAAALAASGVRQGDRVALLAKNSVATVLLLFACAKLGAIFVPLNWRLTEAELVQQMTLAEAAVLLSSHALRDRALDLARAAGVPCGRLAEDVRASQPVVWDQRRTEVTPMVPGVLPGTAEDPWMLLFTGGTSGTPKAAVIPHRQVLANAVQTCASWDLSSRDVAPVLTPCFHTGGLNVFLTPLLYQGGTVVMAGDFDPAGTWRLICSVGATVAFMVPSMFQMVAETADFRQARADTVRYFISGGAPCPPPIYEAFWEQGYAFTQGYGLTEAGPNNFALPPAQQKTKAGSVGYPVLQAQMRVVDDHGRVLAAHQVGELQIAGPHVFSGYWHNAGATAEALRDGWLTTGDLAYFDDEGAFSIVGRRKDVIISGGENVYALEVETALYAHPAVLECAVIGVPDPKWGETVKAFLVLRPEVEPPAPEEIVRHCRTRLAGYKVPRQIEIVAELPKSPAGKIVKRLLQGGNAP